MSPRPRFSAGEIQMIFSAICFFRSEKELCGDKRYPVYHHVAKCLSIGLSTVKFYASNYEENVTENAPPPKKTRVSGGIEGPKIEIDQFTVGLPRRFPIEPQTREKWMEAAGRKNRALSDSSCICSAHFKEEDIDRTSLSCVRIRKGSVPSIFSNEPPKPRSSCKAGNANLAGKSPVELNKHRLCEVHFREQDILPSGRLVATAVPLLHKYALVRSDKDLPQLLRQSSPKQYKGNKVKKHEKNASQIRSDLPDAIEGNEGMEQTVTTGRAKSTFGKLQSNDQDPLAGTSINLEQSTSSSFASASGHGSSSVCATKRFRSSETPLMDTTAFSSISNEHSLDAEFDMEDDTEVFFKSMAMTAKTFYPTILAELKKKICTLVMDHKIENEKFKSSMLQDQPSTSSHQAQSSLSSTEPVLEELPLCPKLEAENLIPVQPDFVTVQVKEEFIDDSIY